MSAATRRRSSLDRPRCQEGTELGRRRAASRLADDMWLGVFQAVGVSLEG